MWQIIACCCQEISVSCALLQCGCCCGHGLTAMVTVLLQPQWWRGCCHRHGSTDGDATVVVTVMVLPWPLPCCKGADMGVVVVVVVRALVLQWQQGSKALL